MAKILVIDDDSSIAESHHLYLTEEGYTVWYIQPPPEPTVSMPL
ncbi:MAG: hypothetical protein QG555_1758 [Thermodesulfobacteriota bacterium]|nr:hypothetical protein [Thermodesulfobacteriota bacterium]